MICFIKAMILGDEMRTCPNRHRNFWTLISSEEYGDLWCPDCGAIMGIERVGNSWKNRWRVWLYPKGQDKTYEKWKKLSKSN